MIDFKKKLSGGTVDRKTNPIEIYDTIDRKSITGPLRPAQWSILDNWFQSHRDKKDLVIKLHTGEGKTLIGLLILQSYINAGEGPCLYVCPNKYLVHQVCKEAAKFGIGYCALLEEREIPDDFLSGQKVLITHAQKLFNGMSIFGVGNRCVKANAIVLDDSHACIDVIKNAYTITIEKKKNEELYEGIVSTFEESLRDQGEGSFMDIQTGNYSTLLTVPYWSWVDRKVEILSLLSKNTTDNQVKFSWPLLRDSIENYECYITSSKVEISPYKTNLDLFGTFSNAKHRVLMSATTQNDSFFIKGLDFEVSAVTHPLVNNDQKWSGEKMLIMPALVNEACDRDLIVTAFSRIKKGSFGIVAIVPSTKKGEQYEALGAIVVDTSTILSRIDTFKNGDFENLLVINNRYDGIDLPDESCRILIIDSMPYFESLADRYEEKCRPDSEVINKKLAQRIEQGIGRGVRGEKDYCALLIIGSDIVKFMRSITTNKYFSSQTRKQIEIGLNIARMLEDEVNEETSPLKAVISLVCQCLKRDEGWKEYYQTEMNSLIPDNTLPAMYEEIHAECQIEQMFSDGEHVKARDSMQRFIDELPPDDSLERGWYMQQLARYTYHVSKKDSNEIQKAAFKKNSQLLKPKEGIEYKQISFINENRMNRIKSYLSKYKNYDELRLSNDSTLDNLSFGVEANKFEEALKDIGDLLGFISQRPDKEYRKGPDNLWCGVDNQYFVFECKNEVDEQRTEIKKYEAGQMNSHCAWFEEEYGKDLQVQYFIIIPTKNLSYSANFTHEVRIIRKGKLRDFKTNIRHFINDLSKYALQELSNETLQELVHLHSLNSSDIYRYSERYYHKTK